ncbi:hypothetical protein [Paucibacter soli]|uniref:hypothetical protein n=1 Tax=Paucibacter soli TaxID=3133433 RepID=UPI0030A691FB
MQARLSLWIRSWLALLLMALGLLGPALAQGRHGDDGEYQILQARYGTASQNVDVTQRLRELARSDREFRVSNDTLGVDPHPYQKKTLRIYARGRDGQTRSFEYQEGQRIDGAMFTGWRGGNWGHGGWHGGWDADQRAGQDEGEYLILEARYGTAQRNVDVTQRLKQLASQDRVFEVSNNTLGMDPHPYKKKFLRIYARGRDGQTRTFEYPEEQRVDGAQFIGWSGGQWGSGGWGGGWGEQPGYADEGGALTIISASYGADGRTRDLTRRLRSLVRNNRLEVTADNNLAGGDPAPYVGKTLWVTFRVGNGPEQQVAVEERGRLSIP